MAQEPTSSASPDPDRPVPGGQQADRLSILVVDDEPVVRMVLRRVLEERGHHVTVAEDAHEAVDLMERDGVRFDAAAVDLDMPGHGTTVLEQLRSDAGFSGPVILISGHLDAGHATSEFEGVEVVRKPFSFARVADLLEGGSD